MIIHLKKKKTLCNQWCKSVFQDYNFWFIEMSQMFLTTIIFWFAEMSAIKRAVDEALELDRDIDEGNKTHNQIKWRSNLATGLRLSFTTLPSFSKDCILT